MLNDLLVSESGGTVSSAKGLNSVSITSGVDLSKNVCQPFGDFVGWLVVVDGPVSIFFELTELTMADGAIAAMEAVLLMSIDVEVGTVAEDARCLGGALRRKMHSALARVQRVH